MRKAFWPQKNKGKKRRFDRAVVINKSLLNIIKHDPILTEAQSERRFVFPPWLLPFKNPYESFFFNSLAQLGVVFLLL